jgi:hypothetical protein
MQRSRQAEAAARVPEDVQASLRSFLRAQRNTPSSER